MKKNNEFVFKNQNHEKIILRTTPILLIIKKGNNDYDIFLKVYFNDIKKNNYHIYDKNGKLIVKNFSNSEKSINEKSGNCQLWGMYLTTYYSDGTSSETLLYTWTECEYGGNPQFDQAAPNGEGGNSDSPAPVNPIAPPDTPIQDIKKFLSCLNTSQNADVKVYAQTMWGGNGVGHAFISIQQGSNTMVYGFYPKYGFPSNFSGTGIMGNNGGHEYNISASFNNISSAQLNQIIAISQVYEATDYDLQYNNCSDFAMDVLNIVGTSANNSGSFDSPNNVASILSNLPNHTSAGNAPQTYRTCP